jgi:hypothetical protein
VNDERYEDRWTDELAVSLLSAASYIEHRPEAADRLKEATVAALRPGDAQLLHALGAGLYQAEHQQRVAAMTVEEQHARCCRPGFEYATTQGQRKAWDDIDTPPDGDGWVRNVHPGRNGWERFDYTEESYWMREKAA